MCAGCGVGSKASVEAGGLFGEARGVRSGLVVGAGGSIGAWLRLGAGQGGDRRGTSWGSGLECHCSQALEGACEGRGPGPVAWHAQL